MTGAIQIIPAPFILCKEQQDDRLNNLIDGLSCSFSLLITMCNPGTP